MGDVAVTPSRLLPKISALYNNHNLSDVEFVYYDSTGDNSKVYGHKLILALRSKLFSEMFYESKKDIPKVRLPISQKESFEKLLKYLYTDDIHLHTLEEAYNILNLAQKYVIQDLIDRCNKYILEDKLSLDNLFLKYDYALKNNVKMLLDQCRAFVCSKTVGTFESKGFLEASSEVIQDIVKLENLSVYSELEIITAVLSWVEEDMKNRNVPSDKKLLRQAIGPFMKDLRFLTLSTNEFDYFVDKYDILSGREISVLTRKMLQPEGNVSLPDDICPINQKRKNNSFNRSSSALDFEESAKDTKNKLLDRYSSYSEQSAPNAKPKALGRSYSAIQDSYNNAFDKFSSSPASEQSAPKTKALSRNSSVSDFEESAPLGFKIKMCPLVNKNETKTSSSDRINKLGSSKSNQNKFKSSQADISKEVIHPAPPTYSFTRGSLRSYTFPLNEISDARHTSSYPGDLTSCVDFRMISGKLLLYGFELKIRNRSQAPEKLDVFMYLEGFSQQPCKETFQRDLCNNLLTVQFSKPMTLEEGCHGSLEVSVDGLHFNRFYTCDTEKSQCELQCGLNFSVKLSLESQKKFQGGFYFTIDKLLYKT